MESWVPTRTKVLHTHDFFWRQRGPVTCVKSWAKSQMLEEFRDVLFENPLLSEHPLLSEKEV